MTSPDDQLDEQTRAYIDQLVEEAPLFSEYQQRIITTAFQAEADVEAGDA